MSSQRARGRRAQPSPSAADEATAPSTSEARRPESALTASPVRGSVAALARELGVPVGTLYAQRSRQRRDEAMRRAGAEAVPASTLALGPAPSPGAHGDLGPASPPASSASASSITVELRCPCCAAQFTATLTLTSAADAAPSKTTAPTPAPTPAPDARPNRAGDDAPHAAVADPDARTNPSPATPCQRTTSP